MFPLRKNHFLQAAVVFFLFFLSLLALFRLGKPETTFYPSVAQAGEAGYSPAALASLSAEVHQPTKSQVQASWANLPLSFEPNRGQTDSRVKFLSRAAGRMLWLTRNEAVLAVGRSLRRESSRSGALPAILRLKFVGTNAQPVIEGEDRQPGIVNYFAGKPDHWRTGIPTYARVRYSQLYPGIDLIFYGNNRLLEYDLVVTPGADPGKIRLAVEGADSIRTDDQGNLVLETAVGQVIQQKPTVYQRRGATLKPVSSEYVITGHNEIGFRLGDYDPHAAVVIDPVLRFSTFLGGSDFDTGSAVAVDSHNRVVVVGGTCSPDFPVTSGNAPPQPCSAFITKLDFTGSQLVFSTSIGAGTLFTNNTFGLALDPEDNIYVSGTTSFPGNFPTTPGAFQTTKGFGFAVKLNSSGSALIYSTLLGGSSILDQATAIAADASGNAYVTGFTASPDFPTTPGAFQRQCKLAPQPGFCDSEPAFVIKLNANGSQALFSTVLGGTKRQQGNGIAVDSSGNAYVTGFTTSTDFPTTAGSAQPVFGGGDQDGFVAKVSSSGSHLIYSTYLGGSSFDTAAGIAVDASGNAYVTGSTGSLDFPVKNALQPQCALRLGVACGNAFVVKLSPNVGRLVYSTFLGGGNDGFDNGLGIAVTKDGQAHVVGETLSSTFPTTQTAFQRVFRGGPILNNGFITKLSSAGSLVYSSYLGANADTFAADVALDPDTNAYVTGGVGGDFPVTPGSFQQTNRGGEDAFVAKVVSLCALNSVNRSVTICTPGNGSKVTSPVNIIAGTTDVTPVKLTQVYLDGKKIFETPLSAIAVRLPVAGGKHRLTVQALDTNNVFFKSTVFITVSGD